MQLINLITLVYLQQDKFDDCHFALGFEELDVAMCSYFVLQYWCGEPPSEDPPLRA
jgi:hypothetical protein